MDGRDPASPETKCRLQTRTRYNTSSVKSSLLIAELFDVLSLIDCNTWDTNKCYFFDVRPLLPCFVPTANDKAEDHNENNINITLTLPHPEKYLAA